MALGLIVAFMAGFVAFVIARAISRQAGRLGLIQTPNERSSHEQPTPSGGGVGIVAGGLLAAVPLALESPEPYLDHRWPLGCRRADRIHR
jgi:Fuc2NAc and GlcNAc transferase